MSRRVPAWYKDFLIMREMGWNWFEYKATPAIISERCWQAMNTEAQSRQSDSEGKSVKGGRGG